MQPELTVTFWLFFSFELLREVQPIVLLQVSKLTPEQPVASGWLSNFPSTRLKNNLRAFKDSARYFTASHELAAGFIADLAIYSHSLSPLGLSSAARVDSHCRPLHSRYPTSYPRLSLPVIVQTIIVIELPTEWINHQHPLTHLHQNQTVRPCFAPHSPPTRGLLHTSPPLTWIIKQRNSRWTIKLMRMIYLARPY